MLINAIILATVFAITGSFAAAGFYLKNGERPHWTMVLLASLRFMACTPVRRKELLGTDVVSTR